MANYKQPKALVDNQKLKGCPLNSHFFPLNLDTGFNPLLDGNSQYISSFAQVIEVFCFVLFCFVLFCFVLFCFVCLFGFFFACGRTCPLYADVVCTQQTKICQYFQTFLIQIFIAIF